MPQGIFRPIPLEYAGLYADDSLVDAQQLGESLVGLSRVSNSLIHFWLAGQVSRDPRLYQVRVYVGPPKAGSLIYEVMALMATGSLPLYAPLLCELAETVLPKIFGSVINWRIGRKAEADKMLDQIADITKSHGEFARDVHQGHLRDKAWLQEHVTKLTSLLTPALQKVPEPVGQSCRTIAFGRALVTAPVVIDEPIAEVLKSKEPLEVGDMSTLPSVMLNSRPSRS
ncbi:MAG: hypothetical protein L6R19_07835 [Alphaproteobacteria bacterium]|nr:hypothetical protein [Alphaproteobacteria bacterium]